MRRWLGILALPIIILLALWFARFSFWMPHWHPEEVLQLTLAAQYDRMGLDDYHVRDYDIERRQIPNQRDRVLIQPIRPKFASSGDVRRFLAENYVPNIELAMIPVPPFFPAAIAFSHRMLMNKAYPFAVVETHLGPLVRDVHPEIFSRTQYWLVVVPLFFFALVILVAFGLARLFVDTTQATIAAFLVAMNPICLSLATFSVPDLALVFWMILAVSCFVKASRDQSFLWSVGAGIAGGMALLTMPQAIWLWVFFLGARIFIEKRGSWKWAVVAIAIGIFLSHHWYRRLVEADGVSVALGLETLFSPTLKPWMGIVDYGQAFLSFWISAPILLFSIVGLAWRAKHLNVLWFWVSIVLVASFFETSLVAGRAFVAMVPALAVLAVYGLAYSKIFLLQKIKGRLGEGVWVLLITLLITAQVALAQTWILQRA